MRRIADETDAESKEKADVIDPRETVESDMTTTADAQKEPPEDDITLDDKEVSDRQAETWTEVPKRRNVAELKAPTAPVNKNPEIVTLIEPVVCELWRTKDEMQALSIEKKEDILPPTDLETVRTSE